MNGHLVSLLAQASDKPQPIKHERAQPRIRPVLGLGIDVYAINVGVPFEERGIIGVDEGTDMGVGITATDALEYRQRAYEVADVIAAHNQDTWRDVWWSGIRVRWRAHGGSVAELHGRTSILMSNGWFCLDRAEDRESLFVITNRGLGLARLGRHPDPQGPVPASVLGSAWETGQRLGT